MGIFQNRYRYLKNFLQEKSGAFAIKLAIALPTILLASGMVIDLSRLSHTKTQLQSAADSAVLAAALQARDKGKRSEWNRTGNAVFTLNTQNVDLKSDADVKIQSANDRMQLTAKAELKPMFVQMFGYPKLEINVESEANLAEPKLTEVAILVDISTSMTLGGTAKFDNVQTAVTGLLDKLEDTNSNAGRSITWASVLPFGENVALVDRVPGTNTNVRNLDWFGPFEEHSPTTFIGQDDGICAELRSNHSLRDDSPPSAVNTFPVWFSKQVSTSRPCSTYSIEPLTDDFNNLRSVVNALNPVDDGTRLDLGVLWAWRSISPRWRGHWWTSDNSVLPHNKSSDVQKIIVVLTDGENWVSQDWSDGKTDITATMLNNRTLDLCDSIKKDDVMIYYVDYMNPRGAIGALKDCASSDQHYFSSGDGNALNQAMETIAFQTAELAITR